MKTNNKTWDAYLLALNSAHSKNYKGKLGYVISYNRRKIQEEIKEYIELKTKAIFEYGTKTEDGNFVIDINDKENIEKFVEQVKDYMDIDHEINIITIPANEVWNELGSVDLENLQFMIEDIE